MANRHGDFIWYELMTTDADAARDFYQAVVGWSIEAQPSGPVDYRMITASEGNVAGLLPLTAEMTAHGARPGWFGYVAVDDVDKMLESFERGGGRVRMPAFDIPGVGRIALVADAQGAPLYVMKPTPPADNPDASSTAFAADRPMLGHCAWNELATSDPDAALHFYCTRFGWVKDGEMDIGPTGKYHFLRHGALIGGVMPKQAEAPASVWAYYFRVADIDSAVETLKANGGKMVMGPAPVAGNDFAVLAVDPQGAVFALVGKGK